MTVYECNVWWYYILHTPSQLHTARGTDVLVCILSVITITHLYVHTPYFKHMYLSAVSQFKMYEMYENPISEACKHLTFFFALTARRLWNLTLAKLCGYILMWAGKTGSEAVFSITVGVSLVFDSCCSVKAQKWISDTLNKKKCEQAASALLWVCV